MTTYLDETDQENYELLMSVAPFNTLSLHSVHQVFTTKNRDVFVGSILAFNSENAFTWYFLDPAWEARLCQSLFEVYAYLASLHDVIVYDTYLIKGKRWAQTGYNAIYILNRLTTVSEAREIVG